MKMITSQDILSRTHYGLSIYCHILRQYYSTSVVLHLSGRDCGLCRNPFAQGTKTLHIWIEKTDSSDTLSLEVARHEDYSNTIPSGDALLFASLHYQKQGQELYSAINTDMHLHIGEQLSFNRFIPRNHDMAPTEYIGPCFSYFKAPINNCRPYHSVDIRSVYLYIKGDKAKARTEILRSIVNHKDASSYKRGNFDYVTFSGVFSVRNANALIQHSGYLCIDFDHLPNAPAVKELLLHDPCLNTQLLFRSPSGDGLKWVITIDLKECCHEDYFNAVGNYLRETYDINIDKSGRDVCRACFLPHDPDAYITPNLL